MGRPTCGRHRVVDPGASRQLDQTRIVVRRQSRAPRGRAPASWSAGGRDRGGRHGAAHRRHRDSSGRCHPRQQERQRERRSQQRGQPGHCSPRWHDLAPRSPSGSRSLTAARSRRIIEGRAVSWWASSVPLSSPPLSSPPLLLTAARHPAVEHPVRRAWNPALGGPHGGAQPSTYIVGKLGFGLRRERAPGAGPPTACPPSPVRHSANARSLRRPSAVRDADLWMTGDLWTGRCGEGFSARKRQPLCYEGLLPRRT